MANIFDVAKKAGVSVKTVSRVMNHAPRVRESTRERVVAAMKELNYSPSHAARELRSRRSRSIGMLFGATESGFQARFHHAALRACDAAGYFLAGGFFDETAKDWDRQLSAFLARTRVQNMILIPPICGSTVLHKTLMDRGVSFVLISPTQHSPSAPSICIDDRRAAREITEHLIALGHRKIGHLSGAPDHISSELRIGGYEDAMQAIAAKEGRSDWNCSEWIKRGFFAFERAVEAAEEMLSSPDRPTAIFAANDEMASAVYFVASKLGLRIPEDLSVVGFDDVPIAQTIWPTLTTVAQPYDEMTRAAVEKLTEADGHETSSGALDVLTLGYEIKLRHSTAPPAS